MASFRENFLFGEKGSEFWSDPDDFETDFLIRLQRWLSPPTAASGFQKTPTFDETRAKRKNCAKEINNGLFSYFIEDRWEIKT